MHRVDSANFRERQCFSHARLKLELPTESSCLRFPEKSIRKVPPHLRDCSDCLETDLLCAEYSVPRSCTRGRDNVSAWNKPICRAHPDQVTQAFVRSSVSRNYLHAKRLGGLT